MFNETDIVKLQKQLFPTGRAFHVNEDFSGNFSKLLNGLCVQKSTAINDAIGILDIIIPDNENFSVDDAARWEKTLSIYSSETDTLDNRKLAIYRKMQFPSNSTGRQHKNYLEYQLNQVGFNCKVYEWIDIKNYVISHPHALTTHHSLANVHSTLIFPDFTQIVANHIEYEKEQSITLDINNVKSMFWIAGNNFNEFVDIPQNRIYEFRHIILTIKPLQMVGLLQINVI